MPERNARGYRIALRRDDLGLDDIVVRSVPLFRMERMDDDHVWLCCYLTHDYREDITFDIWIEDGIIKYEAREPLPDVVYEESR